MKNSILILTLLILVGCKSNPQIKAIMDDLNSTPKCDPNNVLTAPKDTKESLTAKVIVLNYKLDCFVDRDSVLDEKIQNYKELD